MGRKDTDTSLIARKNRLEHILKQLQSCSGSEQKVAFLRSLPVVEHFLQKRDDFLKCYISQSIDRKLLLLSLIAIEQAPILFSRQIDMKQRNTIDLMIAKLQQIEQFYQHLGGIIGYQTLVLQLLSESSRCENSEAKFISPEGIDISQNSSSLQEVIAYGIKHLGDIGEMYPVGGAGDRLNLLGANNQPLPAAKLPFLGKTLLTILIEDLQAREYLHYKLYGKQLITPVALMTSEEKDNAKHIQAICKDNHYYGRNPQSFYFFSQPSVPVFTRQGNWCLNNSGQILCKPGGHGVLWKLAADHKIYDWFKRLDRKKVLVRQINNPIAGCDYGLSAFTGIGLKQQKLFGFASCLRKVHAKEGINVIMQKSRGDRLTCIEYCDFQKHQIRDSPSCQGNYSVFPSNTNILFADLQALQKAAQELPYPNLIVNFKRGNFYSPKQQKTQEDLARIESTMQNITESTVFSDLGKTYLTFNLREKTISAVKKHHAFGEALLETVQGGFLDYMNNAIRLLSDVCGVKIPLYDREEVRSEKDLPLLFFYHPALGPFYSIIAQKICGGFFHKGSELQLFLSDVSLNHVWLRGSLLIRAKNMLGHCNENNELRYSNMTGKCILDNVRVENGGIDDQCVNNQLWRNRISRKESLTIDLEGNSLFIAKNICFKGDHQIIVPDGKKMTAFAEDGRIKYSLEPLTDEEFTLWDYSIGKDFTIRLRRKMKEQ